MNKEPNIICINPESQKELEITKAKDESRKCPARHINIEVDEKTRSVTCKDCGFTIDPFDYILSWAQEGEQRMTGLKSVQTQTRISHAELADLKRKISNARATAKRNNVPQTEEEKLHFNQMRWNPRSIQR